MLCSFPRPVKSGNGKQIYVPCGQCICCRINKTTEWTIRILMEMKGSPSAMFVTLTYDKEHLPSDCSLHKEHFQNFMKRLRKDSDKLDISLRYFACGEYGENPREVLPTGFGRPHYHALIFGLDPDNDLHRELIVDNWRFCADYLFDKKHLGIGTVSSDSIQYVTGYIRKKLLGKSSDAYKDVGILPPFQLQSKGLGLQGFHDYMEEYQNCEYITFKGHKVPIPRYFREKFQIDTSKIVREVKVSEFEFLKALGYDENLLKDLQVQSLFKERDLLEDEYYNQIRPRLAQNHENKIKYLSILRKGKI